MKQDCKVLYLVESFYSIQGEGRFMGVPSIFIRLGGCNLNCIGFNSQIISPKDNSVLIGCDSIRAVNKKHFIHTWKELKSSQDILDEIALYPNDKADIVITGGEPLLHYTDNIFYNAIETLVSKGFRVTIETNATVHIDFELYPVYKNIIFSMSPKLSLSKEPKSKRLNILAINSIIMNTKYSFLKFVLDEENIEILNNELKEIINNTKPIDVYCMALSNNIEELNHNAQFVANYAIQNNFRYSDRLQVRLWNNKDKA